MTTAMVFEKKWNDKKFFDNQNDVNGMIDEVRDVRLDEESD